MRIEHQLRAFGQILENFDGSLPLHRFLVNYFKQNRQMGSSDRRWATRHIYSFFRLGRALKHLDNAERLAIGDFLSQQSPGLVVEKYLPELVKDISSSLDDKLNLIKARYPGFVLEEVFTFQGDLSDSIDKGLFFKSFFIQPDLFIRVRKEDCKQLARTLEEAEVPFKVLGETCLALPNGTKLDNILKEGSYQVQDYSSQQTAAYLDPQKNDYWWDCCAASGGKTLLLYSLQPDIELLVSDLRESILDNLDERLRNAGIRTYHKKVLDLLQNNDQILHHYAFDGIILDAPCTGSGTWGRTPEMLTCFEKRKIEQYSEIQKSIAQNVVKYLKTGKPLVYITCSAFELENESVVKYMLENLPLKLEKMEILKGYQQKADTMFVARLIKT